MTDQILIESLQGFNTLEGTGFSPDDLAELEALTRDPLFLPDDGEQSRLDQREPITCPSCGHTWRIGSSGDPESA